MAILNFVKPDKIVLQKANDFEAQFEFRPLEPDIEDCFMQLMDY